jgi:hypothetical protein
MLFRGFDTTRRDSVIERRRGASILIALGIYFAAGGYGVYLHLQKVQSVDVLLEPELKDFVAEEAPEPEPEPEEEAPPPPPEPQPKPAERPKPKPQPKLVPDKAPEAPPPEADRARDDKAYGTGEGGAGAGKAPDKRPEPEKKSEPKKEPELKKEPKPKVEKIDPTVPIDRPERSTPPKPDPGNATPDYPKDLRDQGVEGEIVIKLHIANDGAVKGMKVLRKTNNATGEEAQEAASKLFLKAVVAAVKSWKYTPCMYQGQAISVWIPVTIPFKLKAG